MIKKICFILFASTIIFVNCNLSDTNKTKGTITYIELEGGFYGIITDKGEGLNQTNLADELKVDGQKIQFNYYRTKRPGKCLYVGKNYRIKWC